MAIQILADGQGFHLGIHGFSVPRNQVDATATAMAPLDQTLAAEHGNHLLVVLATGEREADRGPESAERAVATARREFDAGAADAGDVLRRVCRDQAELNATDGEATPYQCSCAVLVFDRSARFTWASVGNVTLGLEAREPKHLTAEAKRAAKVDSHRVGLPLQDIQIWEGREWLKPGTALGVFSDSFGKFCGELARRAAEEVQAYLEKQTLSDDVTFISVKPTRRFFTPLGGIAGDGYGDLKAEIQRSRERRAGRDSAC